MCTVVDSDYMYYSDSPGVTRSVSLLVNYLVATMYYVVEHVASQHIVCNVDRLNHNDIA